MNRNLATACCALLLSFMTGCGGGSENSSDLDCSDFQYQQDAQSVLNNGGDRHNLDADNDGIACEHLPRR